MNPLWIDECTILFFVIWYNMRFIIMNYFYYHLIAVIVLIDRNHRTLCMNHWLMDLCILYVSLYSSEYFLNAVFLYIGGDGWFPIKFSPKIQSKTIFYSTFFYHWVSNELDVNCNTIQSTCTTWSNLLVFYCKERNV